MAKTRQRRKDVMVIKYNRITEVLTVNGVEPSLEKKKKIVDSLCDSVDDFARNYF